MMNGAVKVKVCGPIRDTELQLPERGIVAIIGPSLSGKSLLEGAISSFASANTIVSDSKLLGTFTAKLRDRRWEKLLSLIDPMEYLTAVQESESAKGYFEQVNEIIQNATSRLLDVTGYLLRTAFVLDLCSVKEIKCWAEKALNNFEIEMEIGQSRVSASLPIPNPRLAGAKVLAEYVSLNAGSDIIGLNVGRPTRFLRDLYGEKGNGSEANIPPSTLLARILLENYHASLDPDVYTRLRNTLVESWKEISGYRITESELMFFETRDGPAVMIKDKLFPWENTSEGFVNLLAHMLVFELIELLSLDVGENKRILVGLEEPEAHLDPYVAASLPLLYSLISKKHNVIIMFTTHSEALIKGIECATRNRLVEPQNVKIYETIGGGEGFTLKECSPTESGVIEGSRFTRIAWKILEGCQEWETQEHSQS